MLINPMEELPRCVKKLKKYDLVRLILTPSLFSFRTYTLYSSNVNSSR